MKSNGIQASLTPVARTVFPPPEEHIDAKPVSLCMMLIPARIKPLLFSAMLLHSISACAEDKNGFDLDHGLVPPQQIFKGGPEKDGIPAIDQPVFINLRVADGIQADDRILGIEINGIAIIDNSSI